MTYNLQFCYMFQRVLGTLNILNMKNLRQHQTFHYTCHMHHIMLGALGICIKIRLDVRV